MAILTLASMTSTTQVSANNTERVDTERANPDWAAQLDDLVNSNNFKRLAAEWSAEKDTQGPEYLPDDLENPTRGTITVHAGTLLSATTDGSTPGKIYNPSNVLYAPDNACTQIITVSSIPNGKGYRDEGIIVVSMQNALSGNVYLRGRTGISTPSDVFVFASNNLYANMEDWMGIGYAHFTSQSNNFDVYVGAASIGYQYMALFVYAYEANNYGFVAHNNVYIDCIKVVHSTGGGWGAPYIQTMATGDVSISPSQDSTWDNVISWVCGDDYGVNYCYITDVYVDGIWYDPTDFGTIYAGSITITDGQNHLIVVESAPHYYPVTFNQYITTSSGNVLVNSWVDWRVHWIERDGPKYGTGSNLHGGGGVNTYVSNTVTWSGQTAHFASAVAHNWGSGSETYHQSIPLNVATYVWGNTVDIWYNL